MYLAFDVGGTYIKYGLVDKNGNVMEKSKVPSCNDDRTAFLGLIHDVYTKYREHSIEGIALSIPGRVDAQKGILVANGNLTCMIGENIADTVSVLCDGIPAAVENDGRCAGLAESWIGAAKDVRNCCVLVFGTGIGGALILDKKLVRGSHLIAGEASYLVTKPDLPNMDIHHFGIEYSTGGLLKEAKRQLGTEELTGERLFELYHQNNPVVGKILEEFFFQVACQCYNLQTIVDPDLICIGGGISEQACVVEGIRKYCHLIYENTKQFREPTVVPCRFYNDSNLIGALYNFLQLYGKLETV